MRSLLPLLFLVAVTTACADGSSLPGPSDASPWFDVSLPLLSVPDGFVLTTPAQGSSYPSAATTTATSPAGTSAPASSTAATSTCTGTGGVDAGLVGAPDGAGWFDAAPDASLCAAPLAPGDLVFDEVMIATVSGSDDSGQWLEVRSTLACTVDLVGVTATAPHGQSTHTMVVMTDVWLAGGGFFLVADTTDPGENNDLPGLVFAWAGSPADALHKTSDTITLTVGSVTLDTLSYPSKTRTVGTSMAFPSDCSPVLRGDFANWLPSTASWTPGFFGTPGAPNTDVTCTIPPVPSCKPSH